jgi:translation initiation factor IF-2
MGMNATERKELRNLIDDEFADAQSHIYDLADAATRQVTEEVEKRFSDSQKKLVGFLNKIQAIEDKAERDVKQVKADMVKAGFIDQGYGRNNRRDNWKIKGEAEALSKAKGAVSSDLNAAIRELQRRRRSVEKDLILGALETEDAKKFVESIPDVAAILGSGPLQKALKAGS